MTLSCILFLVVFLLDPVVGGSSDGNDEAIICGTQKLALEFARKLQPWLTWRDESLLRSSLGGCVVKTDSTDESGDGSSAFLRRSATTTSSEQEDHDDPHPSLQATRWASIFVVRATESIAEDTKNAAFSAYNAGMNRKWNSEDISLRAEFDTIEDALIRWRDLEKRHQTPILLRGGYHFLNRTLELTGADSGLQISSYPGEFAWISGGQKLAQEKWTQEKQPNLWSMAVDQPVLGLHAQLAQRPETHARLPRARFPNFAPPERGDDSPIPVYINHKKTVQRWHHRPLPYPKPTHEVFINLTRTHFTNRTENPTTGHSEDSSRLLADKNDSSQPLYNAFALGVGGMCDRFDPPVSYWCSSNSFAGAGEYDLKGPAWPEGVTLHNREGVLPAEWFEKDVDPRRGWEQELDFRGAVLNVFRDGRWYNEMHVVERASVSDDHLLHLEFGRDDGSSAGGTQGARGWALNLTTGGALVSDDWFLENFKGALDAHGEWFWEFGKLWLVWKPGRGPPNWMEFFTTGALRTLISVRDAANVTIDGVGFRDTRYTYLDPHGIPSAGDWAVQRSAALELRNSSGCQVKHSEFLLLDGNAVLLSGRNTDTVIRRNRFESIGDSAMVAWGETEGLREGAVSLPSEDVAYLDGSSGAQPTRTLVEENFATQVGYYEKQSSMWFQALTKKTTLRRNIFFNGPRAGVNFNDGFGGGNRVEQNLIFDQCRETADHGPINTWDRMPFLYNGATTATSKTLSFIPAPNHINHNFIIASGRSMAAVDNDDGSSHWHVHHNFFADSGGLKMDYGGHSKVFWGNLIILFPNNSFTMSCVSSDGDYLQHIDYSPTTDGDRSQPDRFLNNTCVMLKNNVNEDIAVRLVRGWELGKNAGTSAGRGGTSSPAEPSSAEDQEVLLTRAQIVLGRNRYMTSTGRARVALGSRWGVVKAPRPTALGTSPGNKELSDEEEVLFLDMEKAVIVAPGRVEQGSSVSGVPPARELLALAKEILGVDGAPANAIGATMNSVEEDVLVDQKQELDVVWT